MRIRSNITLDAEWTEEDAKNQRNRVEKSVRYATELTEIAGSQKLVRLYDPSGNLIEVRTPFMCN